VILTELSIHWSLSCSLMSFPHPIMSSPSFKVFPHSGKDTDRNILNAAIRWTFVERLHIEMDFNNLLFNKDKVNYFNRELKIIYIEYF